MKNSGIEWIGEIPDSWDISRVKNCFYLSKTKARQKDPVVLRLARSGVHVKDVTTNEGQMAESYEDYNPVCVGDLLLNPMDLYSGANCNVSEVEGVISPAYQNLRKKIELNPKYFDYYFKIQYWTMAMFAHGKGISFDNRWTINSETILNYYLPFPSLDEQNKIVLALNNKLSQVDELIANQQGQIEKLKEYKQSVITEAVTKGLDKSAPMKDSGIEWIGEINLEHSVWKLKYLLQSPMMYGANESGEMYSENSVRYIRITDITMDSQLKDTEENLYLSTEKAQPYLLKDEDVLFARSGGTVGKSFIYKSEYGLSAFAGYLIKAECDKEKLLPEYLFFYTQSSLYELWKNMIFIQATIQNIGANKYSNMEIIIPSIEGQHKILNYLKGKCGQIDRLIAIKQEKIEKLQEYKKSLIYEYVTGKKEVV